MLRPPIATPSSRSRLPALLLCALILLAVAPAHARSAPSLAWQPCEDAEGFDCARLSVPRDYADPGAGRFELSVARLPARDRDHRIGSLFVNFGGPGGPDVSTLKANAKELFHGLNRRFDIVSFDPRGTGESVPTVDCEVDQETEGIFAQPFATPADPEADGPAAYANRCLRKNRGILPYIATANVARDLNRFRRALGDRRLSYLGLSYGTFLGATYASLFPGHVRALALEGPLDAERYANDPIGVTSSTARAQQHAVVAFLHACAQDQRACSGFGGEHPRRALDALIADLSADPLRVGKRSLDGDDVRVALGAGVHSKRYWAPLAAALADAAHGDGASLLELSDGFYARRPSGGYEPILDQFFAVGAVDQRNPSGQAPYRRAGKVLAVAAPYASYLGGFSGLAFGALRVQPKGVFRGPFRVARPAPPALIVATTDDPATPYRGGLALHRELRRSRLLTMVGHGHGAYGGESKCIDHAVDRYLERVELPPAGTRCRQETSFG